MTSSGFGSTKVTSSHAASPFPAISPGTSQKVDFTAASVQVATAFTKSIIRVTATEDCFIRTGENPTATTDGASTFLPAGAIEHFGVLRGYKIAAIRLTTSGTLYITEGA